MTRNGSAKTVEWVRHGSGGGNAYLVRTENLAVDEDPQHVYRAIALLPVIPERIQRLLDLLLIGGVQFQWAVGRHMRSRRLLLVCVLLHAEPTYARFHRTRGFGE